MSFTVRNLRPFPSSTTRFAAFAPSLGLHLIQSKSVINFCYKYLVLKGKELLVGFSFMRVTYCRYQSLVLAMGDDFPHLGRQIKICLLFPTTFSFALPGRGGGDLGFYGFIYL